MGRVESPEEEQHADCTLVLTHDTRDEQEQDVPDLSRR